MPSVCVSDHQEALSKTTSPHTVCIDYSMRLAQEGEVALTFGPSPVLLRDDLFHLPLESKDPRLNRIFFAGRTREREYGRDLLMRDYGIMNRLEALEALSSYPADGKLVADEQLDDAEWKKPHRVLIVSNDHCKIPAKHWMEVMSQSDFFLACPGSEMPMCHNAIECLAVGTIPIIEYPHYIKPGLEDGVHCLAFSGKDELKSCIERALKMTAEEIETMREAVLAFYQAHYRAGQLVQKLVTPAGSKHKVLVMNDYRIKIDRA